MKVVSCSCLSGHVSEFFDGRELRDTTTRLLVFFLNTGSCHVEESKWWKSVSWSQVKHANYWPLRGDFTLVSFAQSTQRLRSRLHEDESHRWRLPLVNLEDLAWRLQATVFAFVILFVD